MKIERLTLHGFKSFAERTELLFDQGVTGIIGPNGSGKSNIVEAIRFVMGSRARALRAREAEALIFHGGEGFRPMPFAEVELALRSGKTRYVVRRRIDRGGGQEVSLNGKRATFRQIERALAGSGLGKGGYALVGQGEVSNILESGPDSLLERLEEAAGLRIITLALRETKQRLERAQKHLEQLNEQLAGKLAETARLQAEAEEARRYDELQSELARVRRGLFVARRDSLRAEIARLEDRIASLQQEREELQKLAAEQAAKQEKLEVETAKLAEELSRLQADYAAGEGRLRLLEQERTHVLDDLRRIERELARIEQEAQEIEQIAPPQEPRMPGDPAEEELLRRHLAELKAEIADLEKEYGAREAEFKARQSEYQLYLQALSRYQARLDEYRQRTEQRARWLEQLARLKEKAEAVSKELVAKQRKAAELSERLSSLRERHQELTGRLKAVEAERQRAERLVLSGADLAEGPRRVVKADIPGVLGVVADLLEVPQGLEAAAEAALGSRLQWVLTVREDSVLRGVELLKKQGGRATFLAAELARPRAGELDEWLRLPGVVGAARELFKIPGQNTLTKALFGDTIIVETLERALELARKERRVRMVTLAGEVVEPLGSVSGGRKSRGGGERLTLRNRLKQLRAEGEEIAAQIAGNQHEIERISARLEELRIGELEAEHQRLSAEISALESALEALPELAEPRPPEEVPKPNDAALASLNERLQSARRQQQELEERLSAWNEYRSALERYQLEKKFYSERRQRLAELSGRKSELAAERTRLQGRVEQLEEQLAEARQELERLGLEDVRREYQRVRALLEQVKRERQENLRRESKIVTELDEARITLAKRTAVLEEVEREGAGLPPGPHAEGSVRKLQLRLRQLERELEAIGPVNHRAAATLAEMQEKMSELENAVVEAEEAARKLSAESEELREVYSSQLHEAYQKFRTRYAYYGRALLGGTAEVTLHEDGLRLKLQPAGKRTRDLSLLSMGEKTMGALAFLFALAEVGEGSMPIAVLDEVDAPLDEANILRFTEFLRKFARDRQYILVTHQKRSMEACDVLWGVTSSRGSSRVYSLRREEVDVL
ncbi:AAA family ATPase [Oceanithermus sp.]